MSVVVWRIQHALNTGVERKVHLHYAHYAILKSANGTVDSNIGSGMAIPKGFVIKTKRNGLFV
jgi:hypothetical protein